MEEILSMTALYKITFICKRRIFGQKTGGKKVHGEGENNKKKQRKNEKTKENQGLSRDAENCYFANSCILSFFKAHATIFSQDSRPGRKEQSLQMHKGCHVRFAGKKRCWLRNADKIKKKEAKAEARSESRNKEAKSKNRNRSKEGE